MATTFALPERGEIVIGRGATATIRIDSSSVSRRHARLIMGSPLRIEDLGSANGTWVGDRRLQPGEVAEVGPGEPFELGSVLLLVQGELVQPVASLPHSCALIAGVAMERLDRLIHHIAGSDVSVLLMGETGVGKEVVAQLIHDRSSRSRGSLVRINCASLSDTLLESQLFGHERGAFTGAVRSSPGLLETADGGTVLLDEVGELREGLQARLLRVLEDRMVLRVGGHRGKAIDVRFIAATNRDLAAAVERGAFRRDLYFRLNGISIVVPPLRERTDEIEALAGLFIREACERWSKPRPPRLSPEALEILRAHDWPGNVRELRSAVERAVLFAKEDYILPEHLPIFGAGEPTRPVPVADAMGNERARLLEALAATAGNQTRAARLLGISRNTLLARLDRHGLPRPRKPRA